MKRKEKQDFVNNQANDSKKNLRNSKQQQSDTKFDYNKVILVPITIVLGLVASWYYNYWLMSLVNKPLNEYRIINQSDYMAVENLDRYWGTYRFE